MDIIYNLDCEEDPADADCRLMVLVVSEEDHSPLVLYVTSVIANMESSDLQLAVAWEDHELMHERAPETPALFHYEYDELVYMAVGMDDCMDYIDEFK